MTKNDTLQKIGGFGAALNPNGNRVNGNCALYNNFFPGIKAGLSWLAEKYRDQSGMNIEVRNGYGPVETDKSVNYILFESASELLSCIYAHGDARNILISIAGHGKDVEVSIEDDGEGFNGSESRAVAACSQSYHLTELHDHLKNFGGRVDVESKEGQGTRITMVMPPYAAENGGSRFIV